ncbi:hypothetical protein Pelo_15437 [Pelomyxa schiedti]|nr:hypothetical protein Pelo_15437 [Pelomyxa schiedti]
MNYVIFDPLVTLFDMAGDVRQNTLVMPESVDEHLVKKEPRTRTTSLDVVVADNQQLLQREELDFMTGSIKRFLRVLRHKIISEKSWPSFSFETRSFLRKTTPCQLSFLSCIQLYHFCETLLLVVFPVLRAVSVEFHRARTLLMW